MPITLQDWGNISLCEVSDIESDAGAFAKLATGAGSSQTAYIQSAIDGAKDEIAEMIDEVAPDIYANTLISYPGYPETLNDLLMDNQYQWSTVDDLRNRIANPEVLKTTCVEGAKWKMKDALVERAMVTDQDNVPMFRKEADVQYNVFLQKWERAWRRLKFDLNKDGIIEIVERTRTRNSIRIV